MTAPFQKPPDPAIIRLVQALARDTARRDHERELANETRSATAAVAHSEVAGRCDGDKLP